MLYYLKDKIGPNAAAHVQNPQFKKKNSGCSETQMFSGGNFLQLKFDLRDRNVFKIIHNRCPLHFGSAQTSAASDTDGPIRGHHWSIDTPPHLRLSDAAGQRTSKHSMLVGTEAFV